MTSRKGSNWIEMMSTPIGEGHLTFFRTRKSGEATATRGAGYGYFVLLKFRINAHTTTNSEQSEKIPLSLLPYLRKKLSEWEAGNKYSEGFGPVNNCSFTLLMMSNSAHPFQLQVFRENSDIYHFLNLNVDQLKLLIACLEVLGNLITKQPHRIPMSDYILHCQDIMGWATAKRAYTEATLYKTNRHLDSEEEYLSFWNSIKGSRYPEFLNCLEEFAKIIKSRIPIHDPNITSYDDAFVGLGYTYEKPMTTWESNQLLVHLLDDTEFDVRRRMDCTPKPEYTV